MTVHTLEAGMSALTLQGGYYFSFDAISPTTGAAITGVAVTSIAIYGRDLSGAGEDIGDEIPFYSPTDVGGPDGAE